MPPRSRSPSSSDEERPAIRPKLNPCAPLFERQELSDLVLSTVDGVDFYLNRTVLAVHAPVFAQVLPIPQQDLPLPLAAAPKPSPASSSSAKGKSPAHPPSSAELATLPLIHLPHHSIPLALFLRHLLPNTYLDSEGNPPRFPVYKFFQDIAVLESVLDMAHTYSTPLIFDVISRIQLPTLNRTSPLRSFAIACRFSRLEDAREAIRSLTHRKFQHPGARKYMVESNTWLEGWRDACIGDLALATMVHMPLSSIRNFTIVHARVVASGDGGYTWLDAADDFNL